MKIAKNQANSLLSELLKDAKKFTFRVKFIRWIHVDDIETILRYLVPRESNSKQTIEIMARFEIHFDRMVKRAGSKTMPFKALKILVKTAQRANINI